MGDGGCFLNVAEKYVNTSSIFCNSKAKNSANLKLMVVLLDFFFVNMEAVRGELNK